LGDQRRPGAQLAGSWRPRRAGQQTSRWRPRSRPADPAAFSWPFREAGPP
jgi:hypothetical protein